MGRNWITGTAVACALVATPALSQGLAGPYLAATQADIRNDYDAAADFYARTLIADGSTPRLVQNALIVNVISDRKPQSVLLAEQLSEFDPQNQFAALVRLTEFLDSGDFAAAKALVDDEEYRLNPLFARLISAWSDVGAGDYEAALANFDSMTENSAFTAYGQMHKALALALAGDFTQAAEILDGDDEGPLHLSRLALDTHIVALAQADRREDAMNVIRDTLGQGLSDPALEQKLATLEAGGELAFTELSSATDGAAAAFALMASALAREDSARFGLIYGRLTGWVRPEDDETRLLVADLLSDQNQFEQAAEVYAGVSPDSTWYVNAEIGRADALRFAERTDEAIEALSNLARARPGNMRVLTALGDALRNNEDFARASDVYTKAIDLIGEANRSHWFIYYSRGITLERTDRWEGAEADFRKALELQPDQPLVLNYLGYSLVELRQNLDEALAMIEKAVEQRPQDGYITDSLGWVLYRLGKFEEAVAPMERAVELQPVDPIINDHLGDVLWMVGRKLEAEFQWKRALSFEPEPEDAERIRRKLEAGLDAVLAEEGGVGAPAVAANSE